MQDLHDLEERKDKQYETWVFSRMNNKKALCHLYRGHRCIPSHDGICRSCYLTSGRIEQDSVVMK